MVTIGMALWIPVVSLVEAKVVEEAVTVVDDSVDVLCSDAGDVDDVAVDVKRNISERKQCSC